MIRCFLPVMVAFTVLMSGAASSQQSKVLPPGAAAPGPMSDHIPAALEQLFALDDGRIARTERLLAAQDVEHYEIDVCVDPGRGWLSGQCRLVARVNGPIMELQLNEALTVLSLRTANGDPLDFNRTGRRMEVLFKPAGGSGRADGDEPAESDVTDKDFNHHRDLSQFAGEPRGDIAETESSVEPHDGV